MLDYVINNVSIANIIEEIVLDNSRLNNLNAETLERITDFAISNDDYRALDILAHIHTGIYGYNKRQPEWLKSDFEANEWTLNFGGKIKKVNWHSVYLNDGKRLTSKKHAELLNSFKYWITAIDNPLENGGKVIGPKTAMAKSSIVVTLINAILLRSSELDLANRKLKYVNDDFWLDILLKYAQRGNVNGIYDTERHIARLLNFTHNDVTNIEAEEFISKYPHISRLTAPQDSSLILKNREKSCKWLFDRGYYVKSKGVHHAGNSSILIKLIFDGKMLYHGLNLPSYPELHLTPSTSSTEYPSVDNKNYSNGTNIKNISRYIDIIRLLHSDYEQNDSTNPPTLSAKVSARSISQLIDLKKIGRTRTLPPQFVFKLFQQSYEFAKEHLQNDVNNYSMLDDVLNLLRQAQNKDTTGESHTFLTSKNDTTLDKETNRIRRCSERRSWVENEALKCIKSKNLVGKVKQIQSFDVRVRDRYARIRANESLFDLFSILQGSIQILLGTIMARRQDELVELNPYGNLYPNVDPFTHKGAESKYSLIFKTKKTGSNGVNSTINRPLPLSIAKFIWQLEKFNTKAIELNINKGPLSLFNNLDSRHYRLSKISSKTYNTHLDVLCDYMQTDLVKDNHNVYRRNYVRQHQLRRFFAMVFFWSKGFDGIDTLRWMLGHSDIEHLYHYISESETGAVLNGAKANVIVRSIINPNSEVAKLDGIEEVRRMIAERITGDKSIPITIETVSEATEDYDNESYLTVPDIKQIRLEKEVETVAIHLLEEGRITLEPEFFTINDSNGNMTKSFNLLLKIRDLDKYK